MRRLLQFAAVAVFAFAASAAPRAEEPTTERTDPKLPNVPGSFHAFNAFDPAGTFEGRFHSHVSEYGLEPMAMIFTRKVEFGDPLKGLLQQFDAFVEKNPAARLRPFVVVQSDDLPEVAGVGDDPAALAKALADGSLDDKARAELSKKLDAASQLDDKRMELAQALKDQAKGLTLKHIPVSLAGKADLDKYKLDDYGFAFFLFQRGKVTASRLVKKDESLTDADVKAILTLHVAPFGPQTTALTVTRETDLGDPLKELLKRIDDATEKNPAARLHPVLALLSDDPTRNDLAAKLEDQVKGLMLKHVEVVAAGPADLQKYDVGDAGFAFFLSQHAGVTAARVLKKDEKLTGDVAGEVLKMLEEKGGAVLK